MKRTIIFCVMALALMSSVLLAQNAPINFETGGHGANWTWTVFENATNPAVDIFNYTYSTVIQFDDLPAGSYSLLPTFPIFARNKLLTICFRE